MLVGAFACAHTPRLLIRPPTEDRDLRVHAAFARVRGRLEALRSDAIATVDGDHVGAFFLLGAAGDARADVPCYEPSWHHGYAVLEWPV